MDEKERMDISGDSRSRVIQKEGPYALQRTSIKSVLQISEDKSYQEASNYAEQITLNWSIQKAGYNSEQRSENYTVQISGAESKQKAGFHAKQIAAHGSTQIAEKFAVQIANEESNQYAGPLSVQRAGDDSFQSAGDGSVAIVYGHRARCHHHGPVLQVLVFYDSWGKRWMFMSKLIDDNKKHLLEVVRENEKWMLKDTIIEY